MSHRGPGSESSVEGEARRRAAALAAYRGNGRATDGATAMNNRGDPTIHAMTSGSTSSSSWRGGGSNGSGRSGSASNDAGHEGGEALGEDEDDQKSAEEAEEGEAPGGDTGEVQPPPPEGVRGARDEVDFQNALIAEVDSDPVLREGVDGPFDAGQWAATQLDQVLGVHPRAATSAEESPRARSRSPVRISSASPPRRPRPRGMEPSPDRQPSEVDDGGGAMPTEAGAREEEEEEALVSDSAGHASGLPGIECRALLGSLGRLSGGANFILASGPL